MKNYALVILILLIPLALILGYALSDSTTQVELQKVSLDALRSPADAPADTACCAPTSAAADTTRTDTCSQRILLFGDSMIEGLAPRMAEYAEASGHKLTYVVWYSSTSKQWAGDTLSYYIRQADPTYIIACIGGNEQYSRDLKKAESSIKAIIERFGTTPYVWLCTPAWSEDAKFNDLAEQLAGKRRFFDSRKLTYERKKDHHHPTRAASRQWMDSLAVWLQSREAEQPIRLTTPPEGIRHHARGIYLAPCAD